MKPGVHPDPELEEYVTTSRGLIEAVLTADEAAVSTSLENKYCDVNYKGTFSFRVKFTDSVQHEEVADEVTIGYEQFKQDITPLFAAAHVGHIEIVKKLVAAGADVNEKHFRGYSTSAAVREDHFEILKILLKAGAQQPALEAALLEACLYGRAKAAELLISSEMIRPEILAQGFVHASSRGFVDTVATLISSGVDVNLTHRYLLRSAKPSLHANLNCTPLVAAIVARQASVVRYLLEAGAKTGCLVNLGAWSWDAGFGEELRVGAGLSEPYNEAFCAVEYWETNGDILRMLLKHLSPDCVSNGRTLLCHAILCRNAPAIKVLLEAEADADRRLHTKDNQEFRPLHLIAKAGFTAGLKLFLGHGCNMNVMMDNGDTPLMVSARFKHRDCLKELLYAGADFGLLNRDGHNVMSIAEANGSGSLLKVLIWDALRAGQPIYSSDPQVFSSLHMVARKGDAALLQKVLQQPNINLDARDKYGYTAAMIAAQEGQLELFKLLVFAGANIGLKTRKGETAIALAQGKGIVEGLEWILLDAILANILKGEDFKPLHFAARRGHLEALSQLLQRVSSVNAWDDEEYTPLMYSAREGHVEACKLLLLAGADYSVANSRGETALLLARKNSSSKAAEEVILDHLARRFVIMGSQVYKYIRQGKGTPHIKSLRIMKSGVLTWGDSKRRNVLCKEAALGSSSAFQRNRRHKGDPHKPELFMVITVSGREIHFEAPSASNAELWVRGINLIVKEAASSIYTVAAKYPHSRT